MPRIFAPHDGHNFNAGGVQFVNGAAALAKDHASLPFFDAAKGYDVDNSKHTLTPFDTLTLDRIKAICDYSGIAYLAGDDKFAVIRKLEAGMSADLLGTLTVASAAGTKSGDTKITITGAAGDGNKYYYKCGATAPAPLYGDQADGGWQEIATGGEFTPGATDAHVTVVKAVVATGFILASGTDEITKNAT